MKSSCHIHAALQNANKDQHPRLPKGNIGVRAGGQLQNKAGWSSFSMLIRDDSVMFYYINY